MKDVIHIIGHKNPDTDSIVSSIAYAELKRKLGVNAIACRIGEVNTETAFVLKKFQVNEPVYIQNAKVKLYDVMFDEAFMVKKDCTLREAWKRISGTKISSLYVVDEEEQLLGVVSMSDIMNILMNERGQNNNAHLMEKATLENICSVLDGEIIHKSDNFASTGHVYFMISRKAKYSEVDVQKAIVVLSDDVELQKKAICQGASCIVLVDVEHISQEILSYAKQHQCSIIKTPQDLLKVARSIYKAPVVGDIMKTEIISFHNYDYIDDVYKKMSKSRYRSYPVLNRSGKVLGSISRYHLLNYKKKQFILLDHNEFSQSIDYLEEGEILEIIDHHRIGDVQTTYPVRFRNELVGSTCTIISLLYREHQITPTPTIAGLLCCAIISDTMNFNSPTTTMVDKEAAKRLAKIANLDLDEMAKEMFQAVATVKGR
ncbi:MAG: putative manganese-dependent inorganic diphosphatase, partial [Erysipelotrichaceae bacterium]|nr:putative manganese-dependent inorganic diphosphatase [Erysipelotrichaceae bacterium]